MLSEVEGAAAGSLVTGSARVPGEEVSGGGDGALCPGKGVVPAIEDELRVAMMDGGVLRVHFSVTARNLQGKHREQCCQAAGQTLARPLILLVFQPYPLP